MPGTQRVANRPVVAHVLDALAGAGVTDCAVVALPADLPEVRASAEERESDLEVTMLAQGPRVDLLGALEAASSFVGDDPVIAHLSCGLLGQPLGPLVPSDTASAPDMLMFLHHGDQERDQLGSATETLLGVTELRGSRSRLSLAGVTIFGPGAVLRMVRLAPGRQEPFDFVGIAERLAESGGSVLATLVDAWQEYAGDPAELLELNRIVLDDQPADPSRRPHGDTRIEGRVVIHPSAVVSASVILGPTIIGPNARVTHSCVGPYTSVGARAVLEGAEISRSIVAEDARIMHIGSRIEGSTIGPRASIGRTFSLPRGMRLHVGGDVEVTLD